MSITITKHSKHQVFASIQLGAFIGMSNSGSPAHSRASSVSSMATLSRELPMPNVSHITTLNQAHATLLHWWSRVPQFSQSHSADHGVSDTGTVALEELQRLAQWLDRWEKAFTNYLTSAMPSMGSNELTQCRVLKANHLACVILISLTGPGDAEYNKFESDFEAIVELSGAVLEHRQRRDSLTSATSTPISDATTAGLDVHNPLHVVITYCVRPDLRSRANGILLRSHGHRT